ncbi:MAG: 6-phosphogluconolactonase [Rickettsiales bacterium]|jgi:6-phosphogluconolactonase|nr:6-phosphogluconolactonase [Rickettsiales bacterium]
MALANYKRSYFANEYSIFAHLWQSILTTYNLAIEARGEFNLMLSGGNTPIRFYNYLLVAEDLELIDWAQVNIFFSDERYVDQSSDDNNCKQAREHFLDKLTTRNIFDFKTDLSPEAAAQDMSDRTKKHFALGDGEVPAFDFCFLGFGEDGHFASIFPEVPLDEIGEEICYSRFIDKLKKHRLTFSLKVMHNAKALVFIVSNANKKRLMEDLGSRAQKLPIDYLESHNNIEWLVLDES